VTLAYHGVLFLDELSEFEREVLEVLRQPLEDGKLTISRAAASLTHPARCTLVAAMNPCRVVINCGNCGLDRTRTTVKGKWSGLKHSPACKSTG